MIGKELKSEKPISLPEVANLLKKVEKERELSYEQNRALEHAKEFGKMGVQKSRELLGKIVDLGIPEMYAVMIINNLPQDEDDVKVILEDLRDLKPSVYKQVADLVKEYM